MVKQKQQHQPSPPSDFYSAIQGVSAESHEIGPLGDQSVVRQPAVSLCTVTYNRAQFLPLLQQHILAQIYPRHLMEWVIVDDSDDSSPPFEPDQSQGLSIVYKRLGQHLPLGQKRNLSHSLCHGEIIVYLDDDDYYPPTRVAHAVERLLGSEALVAGSTILPILFLPERELWVAGPYGANHATAGTFAFKRQLLEQTRYDDEKTFAEEKSFLKDYSFPMVQLDWNNTILCIGHDRNTFEKRNLIAGGKNPRFRRVDPDNTNKLLAGLRDILPRYEGLLDSPVSMKSKQAAQAPEIAAASSAGLRVSRLTPNLSVTLAPSPQTGQANAFGDSPPSQTGPNEAVSAGLFCDPSTSTQNSVVSCSEGKPDTSINQDIARESLPPSNIRVNHVSAPASKLPPALEKTSLTPQSQMDKIRIMVASPVRQKPLILKEFLSSIKRLRISGIELTCLFVDDNVDPESSRLLAEFDFDGQSIVIRPGRSRGSASDYIQNENTHLWKEDLIWKVAAFKDLLIDQALHLGMDFLFLADSDLVLNPYTLEHLVTCDREIVSEVFWTAWKPGQVLLPQVWAQGEYELAPRRREEKLSQQQAEIRTHEFIRNAYLPRLFRVGGLGACTLLRRSALEKGVRFAEIDNLTYWGEDRHFCIRARVLGIELWADTAYPALHLYRESDLSKIDDYVMWASRDRWANPHITLSMVVRNEADRFLERALERHRECIDAAVIIDDASDDETIRIMQKCLHGLPLKIIKNTAPAFHFEVNLRRQQWDETVATQPDWILNLDADEILEERAVKSLRQLASQRDYQYIGFSLYDMWDDSHFRDDELWSAHRRSWGFMHRYTPFFDYQWNNAPLHCGRFPTNLGFFRLASTDLRVQHLGWSRQEDRLIKWNRYMELDPDGRHGSLAQYRSILDPSPNLVKWNA